jgi:sortase A
VLLLAWVIVVWRWQDPFTALYTHWQQEKLAHALDNEFAAFTPLRAAASAAERDAIAAEAARFRRGTHQGEAIGRIVIGRIGLKMVVVDGTDEASLRKGPGRDLRSYMPGQNRLVYIAGHRTTYLAPFSHINDIRPGDYIRLEMPYATFTYRATMHRIVPANDMSVLRSPNHELLELQACHPRFFATHRYIVYAKLVTVKPRA